MIKRKIASIIPIAALLLAGCSSTPSTRQNPIPNTGNSQQPTTTTGSAPLILSTLTPAAGENPSTLPTLTTTQAPTLPPAKPLPANTSTILFTVTQVEVSPSLDSFSYNNGSCTATYVFQANIMTSGPGTITYYWQRSDGSSTPPETLTYTFAGLQRVSDTWTIKTTKPTISGWDRVFIDQPNHIAFTAVGVNFSCSPSTPTLIPSSPNGSPRPGQGAPPIAPTIAAPKKTA